MDYTKLKSLLDEEYDWPSQYAFKFVTKTEAKNKVLEQLTDHDISTRSSRNGNYTSITSRKILASSSEVIEVYEKISKIDGIITL